MVFRMFRTFGNRKQQRGIPIRMSYLKNCNICTYNQCLFLAMNLPVSPFMFFRSPEAKFQISSKSFYHFPRPSLNVLDGIIAKTVQRSK